MKYWLLTTEYPPAHGGGISTYCYFTAHMLSGSGHAVTIFVNDDEVPDYNITMQAETRIIRFNSNRHGLLQVLGYTARLSFGFAGIVQKFIEEEGKPDFIEAQDYLGIAYYLTQYKHTGYAFLAGVPIVLTLHSPAFVYLRYNRVPVYRFPDFWTGEMEKQSIAAADALISPTDFMLEEIKKFMPVNNSFTSVIANPYLSNNQADLSFTRNKMVYYGKLSPQKGSFELLAYCKELWDDGFAHALHIIGGTDIVFHPERKTMKQLVKEQYKKYIDKGLLQLHGKIAPSDITNHIKDAHVIIVPSIVDNLPYVVMEAMERGKIVLASLQGGQSSMMENGVSGMLFDHKNHDSFAIQLKRILAFTDEEVQEMGKLANLHVQHRYSFKTIYSKKIRFLESIKTATPATAHFPFLHQEPIQAMVDKKYTAGLLSVVIPFFNMGSYIQECLQAVYASGYDNIEIWIINDGSTDADSLNKLQQLGGQANITVVNRENHGLAATRNYGALRAKGEFLAFLDADDKVAPSYYEKAIHALKNADNIFFAGSWVQYFENKHRIWPTFTPQPPYALVHNSVNSSGLVYKRNAFLAGGLNDKETSYGLEDYESVIQMLEKGFNGVILPEILFWYRVRTGSMFRNITKEKLLYSNKYIAEKHATYYTAFAVEVINLLNANGPSYLYDNPTFETRISAENGPGNIYLANLKTFIKKNETLKQLALQLLKFKYK